MRGGQGVGCAEGARRDAQEGPAEPSPRRERCWRRGFGNRSWGLQCKIESSVLPALRAPWPLLRITRRLLWFDPLTAKSVCVCVSVCGDAEGCGVEVGSPRSERVRLNSTGAILVQVRRDPGVAVGSPLSGRVRRNSTVPIVVQVRRDPGVEVGNPLSGRVRVNSYRPHASPSPPETPSTAAE